MSENENSKKLSMWTVVLLTVVPTFGFGNITNNVVTLGPTSIPSWLIVTLLFFLPLSLFIAELGSVREGGSAGIYSWIKVSLGEKWAFIGTWSYFVANFFYLNMSFARLPVLLSWAIFGRNLFTDETAYLLPYMGMFFALLLTWIATNGVSYFSKISNFGGKLTLAITAAFIVFAIAGAFLGHPSETEFSMETVMPTFDSAYFSTFSWLLLAVSGAEIGGTYLKNMKNPKRDFPRAVFISTILIAAAYIIGSVAVLLVASPETIQAAGVKDAAYIVFGMLGEDFGVNGQIVLRIYAVILTIQSVASYVIWMESPIRALFSEVPEGSFPKIFTKQEPDGTLKNALWIQCAVVLVLIAIPLLGMDSLDSFFNTVVNLSALSVVPAYIILTVAYFVYRIRKDKPATDYVAFKSNAVALTLAVITFALSVLAYIGAGLDYFVGAESTAEAVKSMFSTYGGPVFLILAGVLLRKWSLVHYSKKARNA